MTEIEAQDAFRDVLVRLGVKSGDCIMLGIDMGSVPLPTYPTVLSRQALKERERRWCAFVYETLLDYLGVKGSLLVPTFSYACGDPGSTFVIEETPSENGPFTEYFRSQPRVIRSRHPIFSISGIGKKAQDILTNCGRSAFGARSPFGRFTEQGVRFVCLGAPLRHCITYIHHLEQSYGCPHRFNKTFFTKVFERGREYGGEWYSSVGFKSLDYRSDIGILESELDARGLLIKATWNGRPNQLADIANVDQVGYELLENDSGAFINKPYLFRFSESESISIGGGVRTLLNVDAVEML